MMVTSGNKCGMITLLMGCTVMSMTAYAQFFAPVPECGTSEREHWDAAKRIYDIFGE